MARAQDYFSQQEMEPQIVEMSKNTTDWSLAAPRLSLPNGDNQQGQGMDTPPILMHHQIPLLSLDWAGNTTSPPRAKPHDVCNGISVANQTDEDHSKSACEAWEDFLSGAARISNISAVAPSMAEEFSNGHKAGGEETSRSGWKGSVDSSVVGILEPHSTETPYSGPSEGQVPDYQLWEEPRVTLITRSDHGREPEEAEIESETSGDSKDIVPDTTTRNSKGGDGISPGEFTGRPDTSKVKESVCDTLTFTGIRDEPLADRREDLNKEKKDSEETERVRKERDERVDQRSWCESLAFDESNFSSDAKDSLRLQKDEARRFEPVREHRGLDAEDELPTLPRIHLSLMDGNSRILSWWGGVWSLGHVTRALVYSVVLLVIFVTAYLCDLPTCLAVYLFSLCWWYSQGVKQRLDGAIDVD